MSDPGALLEAVYPHPPPPGGFGGGGMLPVIDDYLGEGGVHYNINCLSWAEPILPGWHAKDGHLLPWDSPDRRTFGGSSE